MEPPAAADSEHLHAPPLLSTAASIHSPPPPQPPESPHSPAPISFPLQGLSRARSDQGGFGESEGDELVTSANVANFAKPVFDFPLSNFLPLSLISAVALGMVNPALGCLAHQYSSSKFCTFGIFFISGMKLQVEKLEQLSKHGLREHLDLYDLQTSYAPSASILMLSPFLSRLILQIHLAPQEFGTGLAMFCRMPMTLSSGVALTQLVGGNSALALAMTVISNLLGILTVPFGMTKLLAAGFGVSIPTARLFWSLIFTLLVPLVLGKSDFNNLIGLATFVDQNHSILSMISIVLLSITPWMQVSKSRPLLLMVKPNVFVEAIGIGILLHVILLGLNTIMIQILSAGFGVRESVFAKIKNARMLLIVCSLKALLITVAVLEQLNGALGQSALLVLPCVAAHINQATQAWFALSRHSINPRGRLGRGGRGVSSGDRSQVE